MSHARKAPEHHRQRRGFVQRIHQKPFTPGELSFRPLVSHVAKLAPNSPEALPIESVHTWSRAKPRMPIAARRHCCFLRRKVHWSPVYWAALELGSSPQVTPLLRPPCASMVLKKEYTPVWEDPEGAVSAQCEVLTVETPSPQHPTVGRGNFLCFIATLISPVVSLFRHPSVSKKTQSKEESKVHSCPNR